MRGRRKRKRSQIKAANRRVFRALLDPDDPEADEAEFRREFRMIRRLFQRIADDIKDEPEIARNYANENIHKPEYRYSVSEQLGATLYYLGSQGTLQQLKDAHGIPPYPHSRK